MRLCIYTVLLCVLLTNNAYLLVDVFSLFQFENSPLLVCLNISLYSFKEFLKKVEKKA